MLRRGNMCFAAAVLLTASSDAKVIAIASGYGHNLTLRDNGTVVAWGDNGAGQATVPSSLTGVKAIAAGGYHSTALKSDGSIIDWGNEYTRNPPAGLAATVKAISAGGYHALALKGDSTVAGWGYAGDGSLAVPAGLKAVAVSGGYHFSVALRANGTVAVWAATSVDGKAFLSVPSGLTDVIAISAGRMHVLVIKRDSTVVAWGGNEHGQCNVPANLKAIAVAAGEGHSVAVRTNGTVVAWGSNDNGKATVPAGLSDVIAVSVGRGHTLALKANGDLVGWGSLSKIPSDVTSITEGARGALHLSDARSALRTPEYAFDVTGRLLQDAQLTSETRAGVRGWSVPHTNGNISTAIRRPAW